MDCGLLMGKGSNQLQFPLLPKLHRIRTEKVEPFSVLFHIEMRIPPTLRNLPTRRINRRLPNAYALAVSQAEAP